MIMSDEKEVKSNEELDTNKQKDTSINNSLETEVFSTVAAEYVPVTKKIGSEEIMKDIMKKAEEKFPEKREKITKDEQTKTQNVNKALKTIEKKANRNRLKGIFKDKVESLKPKKKQKNIENNEEIKQIEIEKQTKPVKEKKERKKLNIFKHKPKTETENTVNKTDMFVASTSKPKKLKKKSNRPKGKKSTVVWATIVWIGIFFLALGCIGGGIIVGYLTKDKPELVVSDLKAPDSTMVYDCEGNKIAELGLYLRENIDYEQMPNSLIDAFVSIEDSRFFDHIGFDIPRFTKAIFANIRSGDFSQGGSTITMQLIKNTYFSIDDGDNSTIAAREGMGGIQRKLQEILLSIELTAGRKASKRDVIAMYINKVNYGNNIRGVEKAAQYYFGKSASEVNLSEAAFLAGVINSPNYNNPYNNQYIDDFDDVNYLENGTTRRNEVLNLMVYHGYISQEECDLAKSIKLEDLLVGEAASFSDYNEYCQGYIDRVINEVIETTGNDPYEVGMQIYTNMDPHMQKYVYDMQNEEEYTGIEFSNDMMQNAIVIMNNQDGSVIALGGGRGEATGARQLNRATDSYLNPGSSIKPVVDYSLAFELLGWATDHVITDQPVYLYSGNALIANFDRKYFGDVTVDEAVARSLNTPAVQTLSAVIEATSEEYVVDYLNSIGFNFDYEDFDLQFAIGGNRCLVTPLQLAAAHAIFMNEGVYIAPHTVNYIVYSDGRENFVADTQGFQAISKEAAYLTAYCEYQVINGPFYSTGQVVKQKYPVYGKTGTTDWGEGSEEYHIPAGSTKDCWLVSQTNKYTISTWLGYDKMQERSYFTNSEYYDNTKSYIVKYILEELADHFTVEDGYDPSTGIKQPDTVVKVTHTLGAYPYTYPSGAYASSTGLIAKDVLDENPLVSESSVLSQLPVKNVSSFVSNIDCGLAEGTAVLTFYVVQQTGEQVGPNTDLSATNLYRETTHAIGRSYFPHYNYNITYNGNDVNYEIVYDNDDGEEVVLVNGSTLAPSVSVPLPAVVSGMRACAWTGTDHGGRFCKEIN